MSLRSALFVSCLAGLAIAIAVGGTWSDRLSVPQGYYLVPVADAIAPATRAALAPRLPRRTRVVVFDGLGFEDAKSMPALSALRDRGQCLRTYVGAHSVSQPVYAVLSTGLEQDRTGMRNNEPPTAPLRAESIWSVARQARLSVSGISEMGWWDRLFPAQRDRPAAFAPFVIRPRSENYLAQAPAADVMLIHPIYVDETGHDAGAASAAYRQAVARADTELAGLVAAIDLGQELLVVTADHGHTLRGGHGNDAPRVSHVLTCFAGPGVQRSASVGEMRATSVAPALALLLGLRFPMHMRAGAAGSDGYDDLDVLWRIADPAAFPADYLADRRQAVARFRAENRAQLLRWPGGQAGWRGVYDHDRRAQHLRGLLALAATLTALGLLAAYPVRPPRRAPGAVRRRLGDATLCVTWVVGVYLLCYLLTVTLRGTFDPAAINRRDSFIYFGVAMSVVVLVGAAALHLALRCSIAVLRADALALFAVALAVNLGHPVVFGWHLGFPVPAPVFIFLPYFSALFLVVLSVLALPLCLDWSGILAAIKARSGSLAT